MLLEHGTDTTFDFPLIGIGKSGCGFYAYKASSGKMRAYYDMGHVLRFSVEDHHIIDLTKKSNYEHCKSYIEREIGRKITKQIFQTSGLYLHSYIRKFHPSAKGFINFHFGYNLPNSKEIVLFDLSCLKNLVWMK